MPKRKTGFGQQIKKNLHFSAQVFLNSGAATRSRTRDLMITNQLLYQLSYSGVVEPENSQLVTIGQVKNSFFSELFLKRRKLPLIDLISPVYFVKSNRCCVRDIQTFDRVAHRKLAEEVTFF